MGLPDVKGGFAWGQWAVVVRRMLGLGDAVSPDFGETGSALIQAPNVALGTLDGPMPHWAH